MTSDAYMRSLFESISNWDRWGPHDQRGTLNLIDVDKVGRAATLVRAGYVIGCGGADMEPSAMNRTPPQHFMLAAGDISAEGFGQSRDSLLLPVHGPACTHLDALCHVFFDGRMYNGRPATEVRSTGSAANSIASAADGIVTRGLLFDIPLLRGTDYVTPETPVRASELGRWESQSGIKTEAGDALIIRLGREERRAAEGVGAERINGVVHLPGLHFDCLTWLHERGVSLLVSDAGNDALPPPSTSVHSPIHIGALVYMGLHLIDNARLTRLRQSCQQLGRWEFLFCVAPFVIGGATGSPVNPVAVF